MRRSNAHGWIITGMLGVVLLTACVPPVASPAQSINTPIPPAISTDSADVETDMQTGEPPEPTNLTDDQISAPTDPVDLVIADLAEYLHVSPNAIELFSTETIIWPDSSLGCPQPDIAYTQVTVDGMLIQLRVGNTVYHYHSGGDADPFLCESTELLAMEPTDQPISGGHPEAPPTRGDTLPESDPDVQQALADLSARLGISTDRIEVLLAEEVVWSDSALGCPEEGMAYTQALAPGRRIILNVDGQLYFYHSSANREQFLCGPPRKPNALPDDPFILPPDDEFVPPPGGPDT